MCFIYSLLLYEIASSTHLASPVGFAAYVMFLLCRDAITRLQRRLKDLEGEEPNSGGSKAFNLKKMGQGKSKSAGRRASIGAINLAAGKLGSVCISMVSCDEHKDDAGNYLSLVLSVGVRNILIAFNAIFALLSKKYFDCFLNHLHLSD